jgi:HD-GYP domain-containing protein (c-di-GMP phosphodiesterase class II)
VFVCDAYSAMTAERSYAAAKSEAEARAELRRHAGTQFAPAVVDAFLAARPAVSASA